LKVIKIYKKTSIAVVCSRWDEPFGRTSLEAAANGCAVIISNRGGLPETITNGIILKKLSTPVLENFDHSDVYYQSGIGYFASRPSASFEYTASNFYRNVYSCFSKFFIKIMNFYIKSQVKKS